MQKKTNNIQYFDSLRVLAIIGVIIIHISSPLVNMTWSKNMPYWWIGNVVDSAVRFAVPLFLMLSGATMLDKEYKLSEFYKKRYTRVLVPFLFWMVVYWIYRWTVLLPNQQPHEFHSILNWAVKLFLKEGVSKHFWYIFMILVIYLFMPFLSNVLRKLNMTMISNVLLLWILIAFSCKSLPINMYSWASDYGSKLLGYFQYTGYLVLGYYLYKLPLISKKIKFGFATIFILSLGVAAVSTYIFSKNAHKLDLSMYSYLSINTIIQSIAIFICFKDFKIRNVHILRIQSAISDYSYGVYLVHILVIGIFFQYRIYWSFAHPLISLPLLTATILVFSSVIICILRKIPLGKYISG